MKPHMHKQCPPSQYSKKREEVKKKKAQSCAVSSGVATVWQGVAIATPIISVVTRCGLKREDCHNFG